MPLPPWHRLQLETTTTAFLGRFPDASLTSGQIPFPVPSLRGALAYWLRALAGPYVGDEISQLLRVESELFGTSSGNGRPSRILLRSEKVPTSTPPDKAEVGKGYWDLAYLMGPGLTSKNYPKPRRLRPRHITVFLRNLGGPLHADLFLSALWALRTFGGIGARSRRGFGTLSIGDQGWTIPTERFQKGWLIRNDIRDLEVVSECVEAALADLGIPRGRFVGPPAYPCFVHGAFRVEEHFLDAKGTDLLHLASVGRLLRNFRHPITNSKGRPITRGYDEVIRPFSMGMAPKRSFRDGALGLPVVYTLGGDDNSATVEPVAADEIVRRASPLWLRVTLVSRNVSRKWRLRSLAFYSEWLPEEVKLRVKSKGRMIDIRKPSPGEVRETIDSWFAHVKNSGLELMCSLSADISDESVRESASADLK